MKFWPVPLFILLACRIGNQPPGIMTNDPHSFSRPDEALVTHLFWHAEINFVLKTVEATATWEISHQPGADLLILDTKNLVIEEVRIDDEVTHDYKLGEEIPITGRALEVRIKPHTKRVSVKYKTVPDAEALQWLEPQQTAGKKYPFLFTQSQAILARSWIPCQDSPSVRFTYHAEVTVPKDLMALMSASNPQAKAANGLYTFRMDQPIPSYLMALTVGDISFKPVSERSGVYAEPSVIDKAAWEFADLERMIAAAEALYGRYQWERYDVIVLPPSFPFGGMENPRITFATPTILAGDRSLTSLIAHELAHSWSGNLVTNATWNDFWLNEGFTVYFETRIMEKLYGVDYAEMLASLHLHDLKEEINRLMAEGLPADTRLKLDLKDREPDEGVTDIAYNKGYFFLRSIEEKFGRDKFDAFLQSYFSQHAFKAMDTDAFTEFIKRYYQSNYGIAIADQFINSWINTEGLPPDCPQPRAERFELVDKAVLRWKESGVLEGEVRRDWSTHEWLHFLNNLPAKLSRQHMEELDEFGKFTDSGNAEIIAAWGVIAIRNNYETAYSRIESFLVNTGRRKFLMPLYTEFVKTENGWEYAEKIYRRARPNYHFVAANSLDKLFAASK